MVRTMRASQRSAYEKDENQNIKIYEDYKSVFF